MIILEHDSVRLKDGREGIVVDTYENGTVFMVEICDDYGQTLETPILKEKDIESVIYSPKRH